VARNLREHVRDDGFAFVPGPQLRALLPVAPADWNAFAASWGDLPLDTHLPDGHRYRRRRHATLAARAGETVAHLERHRPHYQGLEYNKLVGGIERWFEPIDPRLLEGPTFRGVFAFCLGFFGELRPQTPWHIECHQFRIEARADVAGLPTPEGIHRDGVDYVLVMLVGRENIASGTTTVHLPDGTMLGSFTLTSPCDAALVDDNRVMHGVTAVHPVDATRPAYRDVLVVTLRGSPLPRA